MNIDKKSGCRGGRRLAGLVLALVTLMVTCRPCPAQALGTNQGTANVTLTNMTWVVALTNVSGATPVLTTFYNFGPADLEYTWLNTNSAHFLPAGGIVSFGPNTPIFGTLFWRCASNNVSATGRVRRDFQR